MRKIYYLSSGILGAVASFTVIGIIIVAGGWIGPHFWGIRQGLIPFALIFWTPQFFIIGFYYLLSEKYQHIWSDVKTRLNCIALFLMGYSIMWYGLPGNINYMIGYAYSFSDPSELAMFYIQTFISGFTFAALISFGTNITLAIYAAYIATKDMVDLSKQFLYGAILVSLMCWPGGIYIPY